MVFLVGCTKTNRPFVQLEMYGKTQSALYVVEQDGTVQFGGGIDAIAGRTTWTGRLNSAQYSRLKVLLQTEQLQSSPTTEEGCFKIELQLNDSTQEYVLPLTDVAATELYYFLEESTMERIQTHLNALPKPSMDVISDRQVKGAKE